MTSPVTFNTIREGKYLRPKTKRDGPGLASLIIAHVSREILADSLQMLVVLKAYCLAQWNSCLYNNFRNRLFIRSLVAWSPGVRKCGYTCYAVNSKGWWLSLAEFRHRSLGSSNGLINVFSLANKGRPLTTRLPGHACIVSSSCCH